MTMQKWMKRSAWFMAGRVVILALVVGVSLAGCEPEPPAGPLVLNDFESQADLDRIAWRCRTTFRLTGIHRSHGHSGLLMTLYPDLYPGIRPFLPPERRDWRGYRYLALDVFNPGDEPLVLCYRIDDTKAPDYEDRVNGSFRLRPGENRLRLDLGRLRTSGTNRPLNLGQIWAVLFFQLSPPHPVTLGLDYIRLEPKAQGD